MSQQTQMDRKNAVQSSGRSSQVDLELELFCQRNDFVRSWETSGGSCPCCSMSGVRVGERGPCRCYARTSRWRHHVCLHATQVNGGVSIDENAGAKRTRHFKLGKQGKYFKKTQNNLH